MSISAFTTNVFVPSKTNRYPFASPSQNPRSYSPVRCTAAPQRTKTSKKSLLSEYYRVLPDNLHVSERPPSPPKHISIPIVGYFIDHFLGRFDDGFNTLNKKYGPVFFSNFFLAPMFYLDSYGATIDMMRDDELFITRDAFPGMEGLFGADALPLLDGKDHDVARSAIAPAFSPVLFPYYLKNVLKRSNETWNRVQNTVKKDGSILFDPMFREHYLAITIEMTTGIAVDSEKSSLVCKLFSNFVKSATSPSFMPSHKRGIQARDKIREMLREVILNNLIHRRDTINKLREYGDDIVKLGNKDISSGDVDVLLVAIANSGLSTDQNLPLDEELIAALGRNMMVLWFAGYITSALTSTSGVFELGFREDILSRLMNEQDEIIDAFGGQREVTYDQIVSKMPILDSYLLEILRLHPAIDMLWRRTTRDMEILGKFVPKNSRIIFDIPGPHTDENLYVNPKELIPERWLQHPKPPSMLSFGGPGSVHYCIGAGFAKMMMKTTFATMLREYEFKLDPNQSRAYRLIPDHVPKSGVVVNKFQRRDASDYNE